MKRIYTLNITTILYCFLTLTANAQTAQIQSQDSCIAQCPTADGYCTSADKTHHQTIKRFILPTALIAVGAWGIGNGALKDWNQDIADKLQSSHHKKLQIDEITPYLGAASVYGLNWCGIQGKHNFRDRTMLLGLSFLLTQGMSQCAKRVIHENRPDGSDRHSFPSGHTASAFMSAEYLRLEYSNVSPWYGVAGYTVAVGTGFLRMYNNRHWLTDVIGGAGVGILSTRLAYWAYPWIQRKCFPKHTDNAAMITPYYSMEGQCLGVNMSLTF